MYKKVTELQIHKNTDTCFKYDKNVCRFGFPKLPSEKTIIARPIPEDMDKKEKTKITKILSKAREILSDKHIDENMSFNEFYHTIGYTKEEYERAIQFTSKGKVLVMKRTVIAFFPILTHF